MAIRQTGVGELLIEIDRASNQARQPFGLRDSHVCAPPEHGARRDGLRAGPLLPTPRAPAGSVGSARERHLLQARRLVGVAAEGARQRLDHGVERLHKGDGIEVGVRRGHGR